jgi:hypothetical protein
MPIKKTYLYANITIICVVAFLGISVGISYSKIVEKDVYSFLTSPKLVKERESWRRLSKKVGNVIEHGNSIIEVEFDDVEVNEVSAVIDVILRNTFLKVQTLGILRDDNAKKTLTIKAFFLLKAL